MASTVELAASGRSHWVRTLSAHLATWLGVTADSRRATLDAMLLKGADDRGTYAFQLVAAMGIATCGLVLGSPGVVIGAMLIAPLMTPILELAMALSVGHAMLLVRSAVRIVLSVAAVAALSGLLVLLFPFKDPTQEILARTSPTLLDLGIATLCALAAAVTVSRPFSGAASTAAGTAIGISLVPPLCVVGFGLGTSDPAVAEGAMLLFIANFTAILVFAGLMFTLLGFRLGRTDERRDSREMAGRGIFSALARRVDVGLNSRYRLLWRVGIPTAMLLAVYIPLAQALEHVTREVLARAAINDIVGADPLLRDAVTTSTTVSADQVELRAVIIGDDATAHRAAERLHAAIAARLGIEPLVSIRAVPAEQPIAARLNALAPPQVTAVQSVSTLRTELNAALTRIWGAGPAGVIVGRRVTIGDNTVRVHLLHDGAAAPLDDVRQVERRLSAAVGIPVALETVALGETLDEQRGQPVEWWTQAVSRLDALADLPSWRACLTLPATVRGAADTQVIAAANERALMLGPDRVTVQRGPTFRLRVVATSCEGDPAAATLAR